MPQATKFTVHIMAAVAEQEAEAISKRTRAALAAAKARGKDLGRRRVSKARFAEIRESALEAKAQKAERARSEVLPVIAKIRAAGATSLRQIAAGLNAHRFPLRAASANGRPSRYKGYCKAWAHKLLTLLSDDLRYP